MLVAKWKNWNFGMKHSFLVYESNYSYTNQFPGHDKQDFKEAARTID